ncbi:MAG: hypothetical protein OXD44_04025 [Gammaproteobacteria bacterium]|nr:hypothetical protein [Gammaproteobacteria bacterium]MCY4227529.1 hypothetical protein [Gammaproteobacteria bacterium]MCY4312860.1 hypothetical protein [Gammaproteobacteria bacterium]
MVLLNEGKVFVLELKMAEGRALDGTMGRCASAVMPSSAGIGANRFT